MIKVKLKDEIRFELVVLKELRKKIVKKGVLYRFTTIEEKDDFLKENNIGTDKIDWVDWGNGPHRLQLGLCTELEWVHVQEESG